MDDYRKTGKGVWGSKTRKQESRQGKSTARQKLKKVLRARATHFIEIGNHRLWLDPQAHEEGRIRGFDGDSEQCRCGRDITESGSYPAWYPGDTIECIECGAKYFVQQEDRK